MYVYMCIYIYIYMYIPMGINMYTYIQIHFFICIYVNTYRITRSCKDPGYPTHREREPLRKRTPI